jgi:2-polyprenyl-6-methoxyphenol hydroxylase-like FAD-dependent oxidoreductase
MPRTAVIVGAGLGGSLLAHFLGQRGWHVRVFERRAIRGRVATSAAGRSTSRSARVGSMRWSGQASPTR